MCGCGGGGSGTPAPSVVSGTVSQGAPLPVGTKVNLKDAVGKTATTDVGANGFYSITVDGLTAPFIMNAGGFYSFAGGPGVTNINPFTHLSMQIALGIAVIDGTTMIPTGFQTQFAAAVANLKAKTDALYPTTIAATQKDFLSGNITIAAGCDKVFDSITITVPDASGNFTVTVSGMQVISGSRSNGVTTLAPNAANIATVTNIVFPVPGSAKFTSAMVSGKSFTWTILGNGDTGTAVVNANGTMTRTKNGAAMASATWSINAQGVMTVVTASIGEVDVFVLTSSTPTSFTAVDGWANGIDNTSGTNTMTFTVAGGTATAPTGGITAVMFSGKNFTFVSNDGVSGDVPSNGIATFNANGTYSATVSGQTPMTGTWTVSNGQIHMLAITGVPDAVGEVDVFTLISNTATTFVISDVWTEGASAPLPGDHGTNTITFTAAP